MLIRSDNLTIIPGVCLKYFNVLKSGAGAKKMGNTRLPLLKAGGGLGSHAGTAREFIQSPAQCFTEA
jgi:hypothetical protein